MASAFLTVPVLLGCNAAVRLPTPAPATPIQSKYPEIIATLYFTPHSQRAQVTHIVNGDAVYVTFAGATHRVRYVLINTPETNLRRCSHARDTGRWWAGEPST